MLGDFNATGPAQGGPDGELKGTRCAPRRGGLQRVVNRSGCSVYWDGARRTPGTSRPCSTWVGRRAPRGRGCEGPRRAILHCARHVCHPFRSTPTYPERDYTDLSDHCPVIVDLEPGPTTIPGDRRQRAASDSRVGQNGTSRGHGKHRRPGRKICAVALSRAPSASMSGPIFASEPAANLPLPGGWVAGRDGSGAVPTLLRPGSFPLVL